VSYRLNGTDPFVRCSIGAFNGVNFRNNNLSGAVLLKRNSASSWQGIWVIDSGGSSDYSYPMEFNPSDQLAGDRTTGGPFSSTATFNDTTNWMIVGFTAGTTAGSWVWRWKIGAGAWSNETESAPVTPAGSAAGAAYRHIIGNEAGLLDDANYDIVCIGGINANLSQASFESLTMTDIASWDAVFTGAGSWLIGFDAIGSRTDRTGNGGNEVSRSAGVTLQSDPPGFNWGGGGATFVRPRIVISSSRAVQRALSRCQAVVPKKEVLVPHYATR